MTTTARSVGWFAAIALAVVVTQAYGYLFEVIDWDESTFLLMGREFAEGRLPYVALFDNKPPLLFVWFWASFAIFGDSLIGARVVGDILVLLIALLSWRVARRFADDTAAGLGALVVVLLMAADYGQHTSSEAAAMAPAMAAVWLLTARSDRPWALAMAGVALGIAALTRSNLIVLCVAVGLFLALERVRTPERWPQLAVFALAGLLPLLTVGAVYAIAGHLDLLRLALVDVPLAYATGQMPPGEVLASFLRDPAALVSLAIAAPGVLAMSLGTEDRRDLLLLCTSLAAVIVSIVIGGQTYQHYWLQAAPFVGMLFAAALARIRWKFAVMTAVGAVLVTTLSSSFSALVGLPALALGARPQADIRAAATFLADRAQPDDAIWPFERHLLLWYTGRLPPSPVLAHPAMVVHEPFMRALSAAGYVPADEFARLVASRPRFLVMGSSDVPWYLVDRSAELADLLRDYAPVFERPGIVVLERR